ncbi:acetyl-CoA carboxylase carboxyl transferase subunit beta [Actinomadura luteofluorescens]|uniref:Acetyl-CoA carboxylase carboxyl transferase subunit beta n=1 Tax=Actinomadura luteofluorescens TaxID=46163 RepID=A0A7Y9JK59_9ACTN|nr:carboxyl transferase domain-containing protein [Actinomadura luteofluorescens]NYD51970.1 acetyl-CoA carboxylase carboxyl transferase subunit beta [Actinomadura luteofluorescens]
MAVDAEPPGVRRLIALIVDEGSFQTWDAPVRALHHLPESYAAQLAAAQRRTGMDESVITGAGRVRGHRVALLACEFSFLAGSIGVSSAERLVAAIERATAERLPLVAAPVSGGTRMQEGTPAFVQMVKIAAAVAEHKAAGLPYLVYLRHPTTGGVFASWGSQGHVTLAEPGALLGFLGPRVYEGLRGRPFPAGVQVAENLFDHGLVDAVVEPAELADVLGRALTVLCGDRDHPDPPEPVEETVRSHDATVWDSVVRSRRPARPGVLDLLQHATGELLPLNGTGRGEADPGMLLALARFGRTPCVLVGQDRHRQLERSLGPGALRTARRGLRLADELDLPLVAVIDTPGADLSAKAEEGGLAQEIAGCLTDMVTLRSPSLALLLGQGAGGAALALLAADRIVAAQHAWLAPLPPEGASVLVHRTSRRGPEMARSQSIGAGALLMHGIVDRVVPELPDATDEPEEFCRRTGAAIREELALLLAKTRSERLRERRTRYRTLGVAGTPV